jgi:integrase
VRRAELARLQISDIDSQRMIIHIRGGKGRQDRDVRAALARWNTEFPVFTATLVKAIIHSLNYLPTRFKRFTLPI